MIETIYHLPLIDALRETVIGGSVTTRRKQWGQTSEQSCLSLPRPPTSHAAGWERADFFNMEALKSRCCHVDTNACIIYLLSLRPPHACAKGTRAPAHTHILALLWWGYSPLQPWHEERERRSVQSTARGGKHCHRVGEILLSWNFIRHLCAAPLGKRDRV